MIRNIAGLCGAAIVLTLPGCWLTFGIRTSGVSWWARVGYGILLAPTVVFVQFYILRWSGAPFEFACAVLPFVNLPAVWLVVRRERVPALPAIREALPWVLILALPALFLSIWARDPAVRASWGHAWYHTDIIYMLANGGLRPEEPQLAAIRLAYPWTVDLFQGVVAYLLDSAPNSSYLWANLVWLACTLGLTVSLVKHLGGDRWARVSSIILICFAVNAVGFAGYHWAPQSLITNYPVLGDARYTPWVRKFGLFAGSGLGLALVTALALISVQLQRRAWAQASPLVFFLLVALAISYSLLFPVGVLLVGCRLLVEVVQAPRRLERDWAREIGVPFGALVLAGCVGLVFLQFVTAERVGPALSTSSLWGMKVKTAASFVVLAPLLAGLAFSGLETVRRHPEGSAILLLTAAGSLVAHTVLTVEYPNNEYKYILTAAICLTPFAAIAWSRLAVRLGRAAVPVFAVVALALAGPAVELPLVGWPRFGPRAPRIDVSHFAVRLESGQRYAALAEAVRMYAPRNAVLVTGSVDLDLVTLTGRPTYVQLETDVYGLGMSTDDLLERTNGYDGTLIDRRRTIVRSIFDGGEAGGPAASIEHILVEVGRPLVIVLDLARDRSLNAWLTEKPDATKLHADESLAAWLVAREPELAASR